MIITQGIRRWFSNWMRVIMSTRKFGLLSYLSLMASNLNKDYKVQISLISLVNYGQLILWMNWMANSERERQTERANA